MLRNRYPRNFILDTYSAEEAMTSLTHKAADDVLEKYGETPENILHYRYYNITAAFEGNKVICNAERIKEISNTINYDIRQLFFVSISDYNRVMNKAEILSEDEVIICTINGGFSYDTIAFDGYKTFSVKSKAEDFTGTGSAMVNAVPSMYVFVKDDSVIDELCGQQLGIPGEYHSRMHDYYGFDLSCDEDKQTDIGSEILEKIMVLKDEQGENWKGVSFDCAANDRAEFFALYGGLFFLGILFGTVFIAAAVLIMYYKQISEGFEDKSKFGILQKVGMTKKEIKQSINSQVLTVFFAPLAAAGVHMAFAFGIVSRLLMLFGLTDTGLFAVVTLCCFMLFGILYTAVYLITSGSYYKIVSGRE